MTSLDRLGAWFGRQEALVAFLMGVMAMGYIQSRTYDPCDHDSWYHIKMAVLLPEIGFPRQFPWLHHTILRDRNVSHHHGFHVLLVPFVYASKWLADLVPQSVQEWARLTSEHSLLEGFKVGLRGWLASPYILGGKVLDILLFGGVFLCFDLLLRHLAAGWRWFWLFALLGLPSDFHMRMAYVRAPVAALIVLLLATQSAFKYRYVWVAVLGAILCHLYAGFVFYPVVIGLIVVSQWVNGRGWRRCTYLAAAAAVGLAIGLATHPFLPDILNFLKVQIFETGLQTSTLNKVKVGSEWEPINIDYWLRISAFVLIVFALSVMIRMTWKRLFEPDQFALLVLNIVFLGMCLYSRRFIEYWPVFCLLSAAALWGAFPQPHQGWIGALGIGSETVYAYITNLYKRSYVSLCVIACAVGAATLYQVRDGARGKFDSANVSKAMEYLRDNTPEKSLVFADDWDTFPVYFYYNSHNYYVCGLDPQFTNSMDPELWERYCVITQGRAPTTSSVKVLADDGKSVVQKEFRVGILDIRDHFHANYVVVESDHGPFYKDLRKHPGQFVYRYPLGPNGEPPEKQPAIAVFEVLDQPPVPRETEGLGARGSGAIR